MSVIPAAALCQRGAAGRRRVAAPSSAGTEPGGKAPTGTASGAAESTVDVTAGKKISAQRRALCHGLDAPDRAFDRDVVERFARARRSSLARRFVASAKGDHRIRLPLAAYRSVATLQSVISGPLRSRDR